MSSVLFTTCLLGKLVFKNFLLQALYCVVQLASCFSVAVC
ncbi:hypothetical protein BLL52_3077 [Rhodoferax antarcticus ANT.BR]|uniref:Uncharacterized protein n=1 Tax=Rhodoferax antarcticus ANT.BR TaxID=1111071 RepID=A0A1Q8YCA3_9BURK|nr:hypothetical protein BLL52_3077 [Rhodoferax antarcticus ANT.BR]